MRGGYLGVCAPGLDLGELLDCNSRRSGFFVLYLTTALSFIRNFIKISRATQRWGGDPGIR